MLSVKSDRDGKNSETVYYWMEKYIALLEDYKKLLQESSYDSSYDNRQKQQEN